MTTMTSSGDAEDSLNVSDITVHNVAPANLYTGEFDEIQSDELDSSQKVFMSIVNGGGKLGVSYYCPDSTVLYMMPDAAETDGHDMLKKVFQYVQPSCVVISAKLDELLSLKLQECMVAAGLDPKRHIEVLPSIDFTVDVCKRRIMYLSLPSIPPHFGDADRLLFMSSLVPFDNVCMVRAVGGLVKFLEKNRIGVELEETGTRIPIIALRIFTLDDLVLIDDDSYSALQIFKLESHPSGFKAETGREGFSLYGILNRCKSKAGSRLLRRWFQHPLRDCSVITQRLDTIEFLLNPRNVEVTTALESCLKSIRHLGRVLGRMAQAQASLGDWRALYRTVYNATFIGDICRSQPQDIAIFAKIAETFGEGLQKIVGLISKIVDFDEWPVCGRFVVKPHVDSTLDEKKRTYNGLPDLMTKVAHDEMNRMDDDIAECKVVYMPQLGYLLAVPLNERLSQLEDFNMPGMHFMFSSNGDLHYKTASTREMDSKLGDTQCDIMDMETAIMHRLQNSILQQSTLLLDVVQCAAELDCLLALAWCAREYNYCRPQLTESNVIIIKAGRHPLQELCRSPFVPNDTLSGLDSGRMKLLTGTNASGKSVYLKQVGLMVFMAHIGSYVPADAAQIGLVDKVFTRIRTTESISTNLSAFCIDLNQVSVAVRYATARSLVILDEFGKGTETADGAALLCACLKFWLSRAGLCPHTLVSTHFHSIIHQQALLPASPYLRLQTMDTLEEDGELVFLYQLIDGITSSSHAVYTAQRAGVPQDILDRVAQVLSLREKNLPISRIDRLNSLVEFKRCETNVARFMKLDLDNDDVTSFLTTVKT